MKCSIVTFASCALWAFAPAASAIIPPSSFDSMIPVETTTLPANAVVFVFSASCSTDVTLEWITATGLTSPGFVFINDASSRRGPCAMQVDLSGRTADGSGVLKVDPSSDPDGFALTFSAEVDETPPTRGGGSPTSFRVDAQLPVDPDDVDEDDPQFFSILGNAPTARDDVGMSLFIVERSIDGEPFQPFEFIAAAGQDRIEWRDSTTAPKRLCYRVRAFDMAGNEILIDDAVCKDVREEPDLLDVGCAAAGIPKSGAPAAPLTFLAAALVALRRRARAAA